MRIQQHQQQRESGGGGGAGGNSHQHHHPQQQHHPPQHHHHPHIQQQQQQQQEMHRHGQSQCDAEAQASGMKEVEQPNEALCSMRAKMKEVTSSVTFLAKLAHLLAEAGAQETPEAGTALAALGLSETSADVRLARFLVGPGSSLIHRLRDSSQINNNNLQMNALLEKAAGIPLNHPAFIEDNDQLHSITSQAASLPQLLIISQAPETALWIAEKAAAEGMAVHITNNPLSALADAVDGKYYHGCIMEVDFPILGGIEALPRLRALPRRGNQRMLIVVVKNGSTEASYQDFDNRAIQAGADYIANGFDEISFPNLKVQIKKDMEMDSIPHMMTHASSTCGCDNHSHQHFMYDGTQEQHQHQHHPPQQQQIQQVQQYQQVQQQQPQQEVYPQQQPTNCSMLDYPPQYGGGISTTAAPLTTPSTTRVVPPSPTSSSTSTMKSSSTALSAVTLQTPVTGGVPTPARAITSIIGEKRVKRACSHCHAKKLSCSLSRPCHRCQTLDQLCIEYEPKERLKRRARRTTLAAIPNNDAFAANATNTFSLVPNERRRGGRARAGVNDIGGGGGGAVANGGGGDRGSGTTTSSNSMEYSQLPTIHYTTASNSVHSTSNASDDVPHTVALPYSPWQYTAVLGSSITTNSATSSSSGSNSHTGGSGGGVSTRLGSNEGPPPSHTYAGSGTGGSISTVSSGQQPQQQPPPALVQHFHHQDPAAGSYQYTLNGNLSTWTPAGSSQSNNNSSSGGGGGSSDSKFKMTAAGLVANSWAEVAQHQHGGGGNGHSNGGGGGQGGGGYENGFNRMGSLSTAAYNQAQGLSTEGNYWTSQSPHEQSTSLL